MPTHRVRLVSIGLASALVFTAFECLGQAAWAEEYEQPPVFKASNILPASLLSGPYHRVKEDIFNDGYINHYTIESKYGSFGGVTSAKLRKRVREINALAAMEQVRGTKVFRESVVEAGGDVVQGLKMFITNPINTAVGAVSGVGKSFGRLRENLFGSKRSDAEDPRWKSLIGFSKTKREYAYDFNVDVYSINKALQKELKDFAWAGYAGGLTVTGLMSAVPGAAGITTSITGGSRLMNEIYATTAPVDLRKLNRNKLLKMGINQDVVDLFIDNSVYSPRQQTDLVFALEDLNSVSNRQVFIKFAIGAGDPDVSFFRQRMAQMYAAYHKNIKAIDQFISLGQDSALKNMGVAKSTDGVVIFQAPLDYLVWTSEMATIFSALDNEVNRIPNKGKELWLAGNLSPIARKNIEGSGWTVYVDQEIELLGSIEGAKERISYR